MHAVLMHVHGDAGIDINNVHYLNVPNTFDGKVFFTTLQGLFYNGYIYKKGKVVLASVGKSTTTKPSGPQILQEYVPGYCVETTTNWFSWKCWTEYNGDIERCEYTYDYTTIDTYCVPGYYIPEGGGGVYLPQCPPTNPNPPITAYSINGKIIVNQVPPPDDDGGDGGESPCASSGRDKK